MAVCRRTGGQILAVRCLVGVGAGKTARAYQPGDVVAGHVIEALFLAGDTVDGVADIQARCADQPPRPADEALRAWVLGGGRDGRAQGIVAQVLANLDLASAPQPAPQAATRPPLPPRPVRRHDPLAVLSPAASPPPGDVPATGEATSTNPGGWASRSAVAARFPAVGTVWAG